MAIQDGPMRKNKVNDDCWKTKSQFDGPSCGGKKVRMI